MRAPHLPLRRRASLFARPVPRACCVAATCEVVGETEPGVLIEIFINGVSQGQQCVLPDDPVLVVTPAMVLTAFQRLTWPASGLRIQPPDGRTAVNLDTYFRTDDTAPVTQAVTLLGQRVTIEATPARFTWHYGDGEVVTTSSPGGPYPRSRGDVVHRYRREGDVRTSLDTTYAGRYRVGAGPWTPIPGTHTVAGAPQRLEVREVQPTLVSHH